jgi:hypothetical protein
MAKNHPKTELGEMLLERYGAVVGGRDLRKILGYRSATAFSQCVRNRVVPIRFFNIEGRRGYFALVTDIAAWLELKAGSGGKSI